LNWEERIEAYRAQSKFPVAMAMGEDGVVFGVWVMGNSYKVASGLYGGYPPTYLRRIKALFPEKTNVLHVFSGQVDLVEMPGDTVDADIDNWPTFLDDAQTLAKVPLQHYDLILCDPPYSVEDAEHYGPAMISRSKVFRALSRCLPGTHVVWLDQVLPMYKKDTWDIECRIGVVKSTNHRFRFVTVFRRK
jgi:hypothetical protein